MSCPSNVRKPLNNSKSKNNSSNTLGSKEGANCNKKIEQILSSTVNSSAGSSGSDLTFDVSDIEKPNVKNQIQFHKGQDQETKKAIPKSKALIAPEKAEIAYANYIQKLYFCSLLTQRIKSETEICFSDLEAENIKLDNEISTVKEWLKEISSLQKSESNIEELENIFMEVEDDLIQLQAMLQKVNLDMKIASWEVPLMVLKMTDASRDEFLSVIQELSNIRNEIISIMKPHVDSQKNAAKNLYTCVLTAMDLKSLIKECCSILPSVESSYCRALSLQFCLPHQDQDFQGNKIDFQLHPAHQSGQSSETASDTNSLSSEDVKLPD